MNKVSVLIFLMFSIINWKILAMEDHEHNMDHAMQPQKQIIDKSKAIYISRPSAKQMKMLDKYPQSGENRELGFDGKYIMESTSFHNDLAIQCAQASRGIIILDRKAWQACGKRPTGLVQPDETAEQQEDQHEIH